jgi:general secretion pathway protein H
MSRQKGFTLLEIVIVIAIVASLMVLGLPRIRKNNTNIKSVVREMAGLCREIRNYARMKNSTYRLVLKVGSNEDAYGVEAATGTALAFSEEKQKKFDELSEDEKPKSAFQAVDKPLKNPKVLPSGLSFRQVETKVRKTPVTKGTAYVHFSAEGLVEQSVIQITDGKNLTWSLVINPLTGHAQIIERAVELKDIERRSE